MNLFTKEEIEEHEKQLKLANEALDRMWELFLATDESDWDGAKRFEKEMDFLRGFFTTDRGPLDS